MSYVDNVEIFVMIDADSAFNGRIAASMFMKVIPKPMKNVSPVKCSLFGVQVARRIGKE